MSIFQHDEYLVRTLNMIVPWHRDSRWLAFFPDLEARGKYISRQFWDNTHTFESFFLF